MVISYTFTKLGKGYVNDSVKFDTHARTSPFCLQRDNFRDVLLAFLHISPFLKKEKILYPNKPNGLSHPYTLGESICHLWVVRCIFFFIFVLFVIGIPVKKNSEDPDQTPGLFGLKGMDTFARETTL